MRLYCIINNVIRERNQLRTATQRQWLQRTHKSEERLTMTKKMTKREYNKELTILEAKLAEVRAELEKEKLVIRELITTGANCDNSIELVKAGERANKLVDKKCEITEAIQVLEIAYSRRDWSYCDYVLNELVGLNID